MKNFLSAAAVATLLAMAGCNLPQPQADTVRDFTLDSPVEVVPVPNPTLVRPVQVAGHLHNRSLAVRVGPHEVTYLDDARWAESLDGAITQLLRARLSTVGGGATVSVQVQRFELVRSEGNSIQLAATYTIQPASGDHAAVHQGVFTSSPRTWDGKDYGAMVGQLHDAIAELGDTIAAALGEKK
jgi:uncharacterized lipoprotein YmbA